MSDHSMNILGIRDVFFTTLIEDANDCVIGLDNDRRIIAASASAIEYFQWNMQTIKDCSLVDIVLNTQVERDEMVSLQTLLTAFKKQPRPVNNCEWCLTELCVPDSTIVIGWVVKRVASKNIIQPRADNYLKNLEIISEFMPGNFYWKDKEGRYLGCDPVLTKPLGLTVEDIVGKTDYDLWPSQAVRICEHDKQVMDTGQILRLEEHVDINGKRHYFIAIKMPLRDCDNNVVGIIGNSMDISLQVQYNYKL